MPLESRLMTQRNFESAVQPILMLPETVELITTESFGGIDWKHQTHFPRHDKFTSDLVGFSESGILVHIEQETSEKSDLSVRMLEYATLLTIAHDLTPQLFQLVYYTGDDPRDSRWREHSMGCLNHRYLFVDASSDETCARLLKGQLPTSALALLARDYHTFTDVVKTLVKRLQKVPDHERTAAVDHCKRIASLRKRRALFEEELMGTLQYDPELFMMPDADAAAQKIGLSILPLILGNFNFTISEELASYLRNDASGWELTQLCEHRDEFLSEADIREAFDLVTTQSATLRF